MLPLVLPLSVPQAKRIEAAAISAGVVSLANYTGVLRFYSTYQFLGYTAVGTALICIVNQTLEGA